MRVDYTSLFGGSAETLPAYDPISRWQALLPGFDATHHLTGPTLVTNNRLDTHITAHHWLTPETRTVHGHYTANITAGKSPPSPSRPSTNPATSTSQRPPPNA
jgi:hypothetical protein